MCVAEGFEDKGEEDAECSGGDGGEDIDEEDEVDFGVGDTLEDVLFCERFRGSVLEEAGVGVGRR